MKKFLSLLLVVMMLVSMIPATVFAAESTAAITFDNTSKRTVYNTSQQVWVENGITVTNDKSASTSNVGNYSKPARFYASSKLTVAYDKAMTKIVFDCNSSSYATTLKNSIGSTATVSVSSDKVTVTLSGVTTFTIAKLSGQVRMDGLTVYYEVSSDCTHVNTTEKEGTAATCTVAGVGSSIVCEDCGAIVTEGSEIPALGHLYEDGECGRCGAYMVNPETETVATLLTEQPGIGDVIAIYYPSEKVAMSPNDNGYNKLASTLVEAKDGQLPYDEAVAQFTFGANGEYYTFMTADGEYLATSGNNLSLNDALEDNCLWTVTANGTGTWNIISKSATVNNSPAAIEYYLGNFTTYGLSTSKAEYKMALYLVAESVCEHANRTSNEDGYEATCTETGMTDSETCDDCGAFFNGQEIPALGHEWVDGFCDRCGIEKPAGMEAVTTLVPGEYIIVANTELGSYALPLTIDGKMNGEQLLMEGELLLGMADESKELPVWTIEACGDGFALYNGSKYLAYGTDGTNFITADSAYEWSYADSKLTSAAVTNRGVIFQVIDQNKKEQLRFGAYATSNTTGYVQELSFYKYETAPELPPVVEADGVEYTSFEEAYAYDPDATIKLLVDFEEINVTGDLYLDLNGHIVGSATANAIFAGDSSATVTAAGTGKLTTTSPVGTTETIGATRYVALKGEDGAYTFHALELKLSAVTLRTTKAGIYYKATMACDEVLKAAIASHGVAVSVVKMPTATFETDENSAATQIAGAPEGVFTSGSITNIFRAGLSDEKNAARGEMKIHANAYLKLADGSIVMGSNASSKSMKDVMEYLNENLADLDAAEQANALAFYTEWADVLTAWNLENLAAAIVPSVPEEEEQA